MRSTNRGKRVKFKCLGKINISELFPWNFKEKLKAIKLKYILFWLNYGLIHKTLCVFWLMNDFISSEKNNLYCKYYSPFINVIIVWYFVYLCIYFLKIK